jgi:hypothetical protein
MLEIIAAINNACIDERRGFGWHAGTYPVLSDAVNGESPVKPPIADKPIGG